MEWLKPVVFLATMAYAIAGVILFWISFIIVDKLTPYDLWGEIVEKKNLALAVVVGFYVITAVTHALHTPLMSVTNAISGIIVVGALTQINSDSVIVTILAVIATAVASINIFGGFTVTHRMLKMFQRS